MAERSLFSVPKGHTAVMAETFERRIPRRF
jgi:hypothetical protein